LGQSFRMTDPVILVENIQQETHFRDGTTPSNLENVLTDEENIVQDVAIEEALGKSDHAVLQWRLVVEPDNTRNTESEAVKFNYWKGDFVSFGRQLSSVNWKTQMMNKTTEESWQYFRGLHSNGARK